MPLSDRFIDLFAFVSGLLQTVEAKQPPYEEVRETVLRLLAGTEEPPMADQSEVEDLEQARFAVCAWVDEMLVGSHWQHNRHWLREQLQRIHFDTARAGEEFFDRLNSLGPQQREVREVYYLCLALGFAGRFCNPGEEILLQALKESTLKSLLDSGGTTMPKLDDGVLFPEAYPPAAAAPRSRKRLCPLKPVTAACALGPLLLFGILFIIYRFALDSIAQDFLKTVVK